MMVIPLEETQAKEKRARGRGVIFFSGRATAKHQEKKSYKEHFCITEIPLSVRLIFFFPGGVGIVMRMEDTKPPKSSTTTAAHS